MGSSGGASGGHSGDTSREAPSPGEGDRGQALARFARLTLVDFDLRSKSLLAGLAINYNINQHLL